MPIEHTHVSQLHKEEMGSGVLAIGQDQARLNDTMGGHPPEGTNPPLTTGQRRRVQFEFLCIGQESRGGFQSGDIRPVAEFSLEVTSQDSPPLDKRRDLLEESRRCL